MAVLLRQKQSGATATALGGTTTPQRAVFNVHIKDMENNKRTRNYATVVYSESAPDEWIMKLKELCIPAFISPIHDTDINSDGTPKKEHYHVMIMFEGVKTQAQAKEVFAIIGGVGVEPVKCVRAYARYLCHLDNPEKAQYDISDVISCAGADYVTMISSASDKYSAIGEMIDFCMQNDVECYAELLLYAKNNREDWFRVLCDNGTVTLVQFLKSKYWEQHKYDRRYK